MNYREITEELLSLLAKEIAADIKPVETILSEYGIDQGDFASIRNNDRFKVFLHNARIGWNSAQNVEERLKQRAAVTLEESMPEMFARLHDPKEPLSAKAQIGELLRKISGVGSVTAGTAGTEKFSLVINIGSGEVKAIDGKVINSTDYSKVEQ
jgi:hypothetical protein